MSPFSERPYGGSDSGYRFAFPPLTPMVKRLVFANLGVYALTLLLYLLHPPAEEFLVRALGLSPSAWADMFPFVPVWQLATYAFLHAVTPGHVLVNMLLLYFFGTMVEGIVGGQRFLVTYAGGLLVGAIAFLVVGLVTGSSVPAVGASGAVLAIVVAAACFRPDAQVILILVPVPLKWLAAGVVGLDLIHGALAWRDGMGDGVAHLVHLGGAVYGFVAVKRGLVWRDPIQRVRVRRAIAAEERRQTEQRQVDELLQKIHREGLNSLSRRERSFLKRVSSKR